MCEVRDSPSASSIDEWRATFRPCVLGAWSECGVIRIRDAAVVRVIDAGDVRLMNSSTFQLELTSIVGSSGATFAPNHNLDDLHDESLHHLNVEPFAVVRPTSTSQVARIVAVARHHCRAITPRGSGTGLSRAATPVPDGIVVSFELMNQIIRVDLIDHVAVVQPGVTLRELGEALKGTGLHYPVYPGELSGSIGGNVNTNAGGMRAVRHGVTRHHVLGLELVLADTTVVRTGGAIMKTSSGYDLTHLVLGSEGTLALVTEVTLKLSPQFEHSVAVLVPYESLRALNWFSDTKLGLSSPVVLSGDIARTGHRASHSSTFGDGRSGRTFVSSRRGIVLALPIWSRLVTR
jgi:FAD/FMN-containing dehydrogenase